MFIGTFEIEIFNILCYKSKTTNLKMNQGISYWAFYHDDLGLEYSDWTEEKAIKWYFDEYLVPFVSKHPEYLKEFDVEKVEELLLVSNKEKLLEYMEENDGKIQKGTLSEIKNSINLEELEKVLCEDVFHYDVNLIMECVENHIKSKYNELSPLDALKIIK